MKNMSHRSGVTRARPRLNSSFIGKLGDLCSSAPADNSPSTGPRGEIFDRYFLTLSSWPPFKRRNRMDSGSKAIVTTAISNGIEPLTTNTACHPKREISAAAMKPPTAAPIEKPQNMVMTAVALNFLGTYSEVNAMVFGMAPPRPKPVINRKIRRDSKELAVAVMSDITPKVRMQNRRIGFRPK